MEIHLGSLSKPVTAESNGAKLWEKLHDLVMKNQIQLKKVLEDLGKLAPSTIGPLENYLLNDKVSDMLENVYYDLLREGTPLSEKEQHQLKDFWGLNEATSAHDHGQDGKYHPEDEMMHHLIQAYLCKKFGKEEWYKKHMDFAMDHASNGSHGYTRTVLEDMVKDGKELFHDMDEDEMNEAPTEFVKSPWDSEIGQ
jgi:hypothetical protein